MVEQHSHAYVGHIEPFFLNVLHGNRETVVSERIAVMSVLEGTEGFVLVPFAAGRGGVDVGFFEMWTEGLTTDTVSLPGCMRWDGIRTRLRSLIPNLQRQR